MRYILGQGQRGGNSGNSSTTNAGGSNTGDMYQNLQNMVQNTVNREMARFMPGQDGEDFGYGTEVENRRGVPGTGPYSRRRRRGYRAEGGMDTMNRSREMGYLAHYDENDNEREEEKGGYGEEMSIKSVVGKMLHKKMEHMKEDILEEVGGSVAKPIKEILHKKLTPIMEHLKELEETIEELKHEKKKMKKKEKDEDKEGDD